VQIHLQSLSLYRWYAPGGKSQESYKLDHISSVELGTNKIDYSEYDSLHQLYKHNYQKFIEYNIRDVEIIVELEEKLKNVQLSELPKEPTTFETAKSFLSELVSFGAPLLDKHFELKQQQLEIERMKAQGSKPAVQAPNYQAPEVKKELELENKVKAWIESKSEDQELYNSLIAIYYNSGNITKFAELLNNFNNELYEECKRQVR